ncbi:MAG TPA: hypothetical protein VGI75_11455 [Pirellulales bacterium]|jgi:hypothetical protein
MRKLTILMLVTIVPAFGCDCLSESVRRADVWAQQRFFTPHQPAIAAPMDAVCGGGAPPSQAPCGPAVADSGCDPSNSTSAVSGYVPETVINESSDEVIPGPALPEVSDGVLKQQ